MSHTLINCTCKNRLGFSLLPFTLIPQYLKRFNWSKTRQNKRNLETKQWNPLSFRLFPLAASMISRSLQTVRRMREAWKRETYVRSQSFSSESAVKYLQDSNIPSPGRARSFKCPTPGHNQIPTPFPAPPPPHPAGITLIGTLSREGPVTRTAPISRG